MIHQDCLNSSVFSFLLNVAKDLGLMGRCFTSFSEFLQPHCHEDLAVTAFRVSVGHHSTHRYPWHINSLSGGACTAKPRDRQTDSEITDCNGRHLVHSMQYKLSDAASDPRQETSYCPMPGGTKSLLTWCNVWSCTAKLRQIMLMSNSIHRAYVHTSSDTQVTESQGCLSRSINILTGMQFNII